MLDVRELLHEMMSMGATDLYLCTGAPPVLRIDGSLKRMDYPDLTPVTAQQSVYALLNSSRRTALEQHLKADFAYSIPGLSRFRVSLSLVRGTVAALFRTIPMSVPTVDQLCLPPDIAALAEAVSGLVIVAGPAGSGRSTTLAALIDRINATRECTIQSIEDPIEFIHDHQRAIVAQQEIGMDSPSYLDSLEQATRQGHDVLMLGSLEDYRCAQIAISMAEAGRLVLIAVRARNAVEAIQAIVALFPVENRRTVLAQLSGSLNAVCAQILVPRRDKGRIAVFQQLTLTPEIRSLLRFEDYGEIERRMSDGSRGMTTFESSLEALGQQGMVEVAAVESQFAHYLESDGLPPERESTSESKGGEAG